MASPLRPATLLAAALGAGLLLPGQAADLRPAFTLPSQREVPNAAQQQQQVPIAVPQPARPSEAVYERFALEARPLDAKKREALRRDFVRYREDALRRRAGDEVMHYQRLLDILDRIAAERGERR
jgi:hypothetical protein